MSSNNIEQNIPVGAPFPPPSSSPSSSSCGESSLIGHPSSYYPKYSSVSHLLTLLDECKISSSSLIDSLSSIPSFQSLSLNSDNLYNFLLSHSTVLSLQSDDIFKESQKELYGFIFILKGNLAFSLQNQNDISTQSSSSLSSLYKEQIIKTSFDYFGEPVKHLLNSPSDDTFYDFSITAIASTPSLSSSSNNDNNIYLLHIYECDWSNFIPPPSPWIESFHFYTFLRSIALFSELPHLLLKKLSLLVEWKYFPTNSIICKQGDISTGFYIIAHGSVNVSAISAGGTVIPLDSLHQGDWAGELSLAPLHEDNHLSSSSSSSFPSSSSSSRIRTATLTSSSDSFLLFIRAEKFQKISKHLANLKEFHTIIHRRTANSLKTIPLFNVLKKNTNNYQNSDLSPNNSVPSSPSSKNNIIYYNPNNNSIPNINNNSANNVNYKSNYHMNTPPSISPSLTRWPSPILSTSNSSSGISTSQSNNNIHNNSPTPNASPSSTSSSFFSSSSFDESTLSILGELFHFEQFPSGHVVFREGDSADGFYIIHRGTVAVCAKQSNDEYDTSGNTAISLLLSSSAGSSSSTNSSFSSSVNGIPSSSSSSSSSPSNRSSLSNKPLTGPEILNHPSTVILTELTKNDWVGEISLVSNTPRTATVICTTPCVMLKLKREHFDRFLCLVPEVKQTFLRVMSMRTAVTLGSIPFFQWIKENKPWSKIGILGSMFQFEFYQKGETVIREGEDSNKFYIIVDGTAEVSKIVHLQDGTPQLFVLDILSKNSWFGESALITKEEKDEKDKNDNQQENKDYSKEKSVHVDSSNPSSSNDEDPSSPSSSSYPSSSSSTLSFTPRLATITCLEDCLLLSVTREKFLKFLQVSPSIVEHFNSILNHRIVGILQQIPLFQHIKEDRPFSKLELLASLFKHEYWGSELPVITVGQKVDDDETAKFYIIAIGSVTVQSNNGNFNILTKNEFFGEISLLKNVPRTMNVTTRESTVFLTLTKSKFQQFLTLCPEMKEPLDFQTRYPDQIQLFGKKKRGSSSVNGRNNLNNNNITYLSSSPSYGNYLDVDSYQESYNGYNGGSELSVGEQNNSINHLSNSGSNGSGDQERSASFNIDEVTFHEEK